MKYPCGIIRDLLPLYIDGVCNEESKQAVSNHLAECQECRNCYEAMKEAGQCAQKGNENGEELEMAMRLKRVKKRIHKKITRILLCAAAAVLICIGCYHLLFNAAIKDVAFGDVSISANVYSVEELRENMEGQEIDSDSVVISADESDISRPVAVRIPEIGDALIHITENTLEKYQSLSVITVQSNYFLRDIEKDRKDDTIYVTAIKTTLLNNKANTFQNNICTLEFGEINTIVYMGADGTETVLWSR